MEAATISRVCAGLFVTCLIASFGECYHLKLSLYYETLYPDSRDFIVNQLYPTIKSLGGVTSVYLEPELIPYGKATTQFVNGTFQFQCQHGDQECEGNRVHACAIQKLPAADAVAFVNCSMAAFNSPKSDPDCAASLGIKYEKIQKCLDSWEGNALLAVHGIRTHDLQPKLTSVPWMLFNNESNEEEINKAQKNLVGLLCDKLKTANGTLPSNCS